MEEGEIKSISINDNNSPKYIKVIKHIKAFDDLENNPELKKFHGNEEECWIKWFFNITEEELQ